MSPDTKALRRYHAGVERALGLFDATNEWADYIAFLSRLLKSLQAAPPEADIPLKRTLARCLAQCLRPSLPSGVHQKALEVYSTIFTILGRDGLSQDLALYLPGIAHTFSFASLSTRPWLLSLYEDHILNLEYFVLRPGLKSIILSLLPGIEEESSEDFDQNFAALDRLRQIFSKVHSEEIYWQSLFLASITSTGKRGGVLVYLIRCLPQLDPGRSVQTKQSVDASYDDVNIVTTPEPGLLLRCFATGLMDEHPLIQRGFLDLLVSHLPLHASILQEKSAQADLDILVAAAMTIVLRKDMGLNRRLWAWFNGSEDRLLTTDLQPPTISAANQPFDMTNGLENDKSTDKSYFAIFGYSSVVRCFNEMLQRKQISATERARPFRLLLSLMDRSSIGGPVVQEMFEPLMHDLQLYQNMAPSQDAFDEVFRSANVFFDAVEPQIVASQVFKLLHTNDFGLVEFLVSNFSLEEDELSRIYLPMIILDLSERLRLECKEQPQHDAGSTFHVAAILDSFLDLLPGRPFSTASSTEDAENDSADLRKEIAEFFAPTSQRAPVKKIHFGADFMEQRTLLNIGKGLLYFFTRKGDDVVLKYLSTSFEKATARTNSFWSLASINFIDQIQTWTASLQQEVINQFPVLRNVVVILRALKLYDLDHQSLSEVNVQLIIPVLIQQFWICLSPSTPQYHVESVEMIWLLRALTADSDLVDSIIITLLSGSNQLGQRDGHPISNFGVFWMHSRPVDSTATAMVNGNKLSAFESQISLFRAPLLHILDHAETVSDDDPYKAWMTGLPSLGVFFDLTLEEIQNSPNDLQTMLAGLTRIWKLISLSQQNNLRWKEVSSANGPLPMVLGWLLPLIVSIPANNLMQVQILKIIQISHEGAEAPLNEAIIATLSRQIAGTENGSDTQTQVLDTIQKLIALPKSKVPPADLLAILIDGISTKPIDANIDKWITLLCNTVPLYSSSIFFSNLLKMTACFCKKIQTYFVSLQRLFSTNSSDNIRDSASQTPDAVNPERSITNLFAGLEYILARAHTQATEQLRNSSDSHGATVVETPQLRSVANNRLTVILCMQDSIRVCGQIWFWRSTKPSTSLVVDTKSFNHMSTRLRNRTRRMLEHLIDAEPQECLETLIGIWVNAAKQASNQKLVLNLLQTLDGARPKFMMPATFNAIYSRTNSVALDHTQTSSLSIDMSSTELLAFLIEYLDALEDDLLEEIWNDCTTFLRDILANPMPYRQILFRLLEFVAIISRKMEHTNFGEESRMRRELADLCARLFAAIFTIRPGGLELAPASTTKDKKQSLNPRFEAANGIEVLCTTLPSVAAMLNESDRATTVYTGIDTNIMVPIIRSKHFPQNINSDVLKLLQILSKSTLAAKFWRKNVSDAFNDQRFFRNVATNSESGWLPLLQQLAILDKSFMAELIARLLPPTTAGLMFGVGATTARNEADKRTSLNLRRIATLLLSSERDMFLLNLPLLLTKIEELLTATITSSPSSITRADIYIILRAVVLSFPESSLVQLWPVLNAELHALFSDIIAHTEAKLSITSHLQGAKLLDLLLLLKPEEFQLHEWLYITDTIDAIYPPASPLSTAELNEPQVNGTPAALVDHIGHILSEANNGTGGVDLPAAKSNELRKPWLCTELSRNPEMYTGLLNSFFRQLSIHAFEDVYSLEPVDIRAARADLLSDMFGDTAE